MKNEYKKAFEKVDVSNQLERKILDMTINKKTNKKWIFVHPIAACLLLCLFIGGAVVSAQMGLWSNVFNSADKGLQNSLEHGYVQNVEMDYQFSNDIGVKVENVLMDNSTFAIVFDIKLTEAMSEKIDNLKLEDLVIKDEMGNIYYGEGLPNQLVTSSSESTESADGIHIKRAYIIENAHHTNPESKKVYIAFSGLRFFNGSKMFDFPRGEWNFEIDMSDKFMERIAQSYTASINDDVEIIYANLTSTGLDIKYKFNGIVFPENYLYATIIDANGNEYSQVRGVNEDNSSGNTIITTSFPITLFNATDTLNLVIDNETKIEVGLTKTK